MAIEECKKCNHNIEYRPEELDFPEALNQDEKNFPSVQCDNCGFINIVKSGYCDDDIEQTDTQ